MQKITSTRKRFRVCNIIFLFVIFTFSINSVHAQAIKKKAPNTSKTASPVTSPVASPVVIKEFRIDGQVFIVTKGGDNKKLALVSVNAYNPSDVINSLIKTEERDRKLREEADKNLAIANTNLQNAKIAQINSDSDEIVSYINQFRGSGIPYSRIAPLIKQKEEIVKKIGELKLRPFEDSKKNAELQRQQLRTYRHFINSFDAPSLSLSKSDPDGIFDLTLPAGQYILAALGRRSVNGVEELYEWLVKIDLSASNKKIMLSNDNLSFTRCPECIPLPELMSTVISEPPPTDNSPALTN